jgi:hypothetical protein
MKPEPIQPPRLEEDRGRSYAIKKALSRNGKEPLKSTERKGGQPMIPSPSLAGQTEIVNQAVLLAPVHRSPTSSHAFGTVTVAGSLAVTVAGPRRIPTGFPIKSCDA